MENLIAMAQKGDKEAFTELILEIKNDLYKIAKCRLYSEDDIEDAVQETMIKAFKAIKKLNKKQSYKKWIISILINECNNVYKKNKNINVSFDSLELDNIYSNIDSYNNLEKQDFYTLLHGLKYEERITIMLFYVEDYSIKEISKALKTNENTIKTWLKRGKQKIKQKYEKGNE
ncbi:MAG: sigma-70 family RNA polymerase sigma factor [Bacteroidales bacterium]|nr:sigma-70 family RNA polymerase sigma factor [Bacteroidales bacterium]